MRYRWLINDSLRRFHKRAQSKRQPVTRTFVVAIAGEYHQKPVMLASHTHCVGRNPTGVAYREMSTSVIWTGPHTPICNQVDESNVVISGQEETEKKE
ncbi:MAG: hypothetical protein NTX81_08920 [Candidatus Bathyarchaeota archaeon]|nr:hypothetical protein [Candidatus Bathyarchaeota archaeon]